MDNLNYELCDMIFDSSDIPNDYNRLTTLIIDLRDVYFIDISNYISLPKGMLESIKKDGILDSMNSEYTELLVYRILNNMMLDNTITISSIISNTFNRHYLPTDEVIIDKWANIEHDVSLFKTILLDIMSRHNINNLIMRSGFHYELIEFSVIKSLENGIFCIETYIKKGYGYEGLIDKYRSE